MAKESLNLHLALDEGREFDCAVALQARLPTGQFRVLCQLAAELVARWESASSGQRIVVVPAAGAEADIQRHLRLRPTAAVPE